jgi:peptidyl-prolyl cis-trans isomerase C/peptidyl-prolyl cis-trans isomerase D
MRQLTASLIFLLALNLPLVSNAEKDAKDSEVVAQIGSKTLTVAEFNKKFHEVKSQTLNPPTKEQFLEDLVRFYVGLQEAEKRNIKNEPMVQDRIQQEIYKGLLEKTIGSQVSKIKVDENQMKEWYKTNPELRTSHILIEFKPESKPEEVEAAKKRALEIYQEVKTSKRPFEELVRLYTDDALSKQTGGDVGWQTRLTLVPSYYNAALKMKVGDVGGLVETAFGFHIIKLTGKRTYENANKRQIRTAVFDEKRLEIFNVFFEKLKKEYSIKINTKALQ